MKYLLIFLSVFSIHIANAQTFEIRTTNKGNGEIGVEMRETSGTIPSTSDFLTDLVFGIKWSNSYGVNLNNITNNGYNIIKSGTRQTSGAYHFQAFAANATPFMIPSNWTVNTWVEIMSISNDQQSIGIGNFEICEVGFDVTTEPNIGINLVDYTPTINGSAVNVALPVEWLDFFILQVENNVQLELNWTLASEYNNAYFEVQKSRNGVNWEGIGQVASKGNTNEITKYTFLDTNPYDKNYYRLKQVDLDNQYEYSKVLFIEFNHNNLVNLKVYPNPTIDILNVAFSKIEENATIQVFNIQGKNMPVRINTSDNQHYNINTSLLEKGHYFLKIEYDNVYMIKQFVIL